MSAVLPRFSTLRRIFPDLNWFCRMSVWTFANEARRGESYDFWRSDRVLVQKFDDDQEWGAREYIAEVGL